MTRQIIKLRCSHCDRVYAIYEGDPEPFGWKWLAEQEGIICKYCWRERGHAAQQIPAAKVTRDDL